MKAYPVYRQQDVETPHFKIPFQFESHGGHAMVNEQDSQSDLIDCVRMILGFPVGSRDDMLEYGYPELLFHQLNTDEIVGRLHNAVRRWEPRLDSDVQLRAVLDEGYIQQLEIRARGSIPS